MDDQNPPNKGAAPSDDYEVGYARPPKHSRFKPGQSGCPQGRRKGSLNWKTLVERKLTEKVSRSKGGKPCKMTKCEALVQTLTDKAVDGDARAVATLFNLVDHVGLVGSCDMEDQTPKPLRVSDAWIGSIDPSLLSSAERADLARLAHIIDRGDFTALDTSQFERLKVLIAKGHAGTVN